MAGVRFGSIQRAGIVAAVALVATLAGIAGPPASAQAVRVWTGGGSDANWSNPANWGGTAPAAGDSLVFPPGASRLVTKNDLAPGTLVAKITIGRADYSLAGNDVSLEEGIAATQSAGTAWVSLNLLATGETLPVTVAEGGVLVLGGDIVAPTVLKDGHGRVIFDGDLSGGLDVVDGSAVLNGDAPGTVLVEQHGRLRGHGSMGALESVGGFVAPSGILTASSADFDSSSTFAVELDGPDAGTGYAQLVTATAPKLGWARLLTDVGSPVRPGVGTVFTIIRNDGQEPVEAMFDGLTEGATFRSGNTILKISYRGGDGNDVTLTVVELVDADVRVAMTASPEPVAPGGILTYTIVVSNAGPYDAEELYFIMPVSEGVTFVSFAGAEGWSCELPPMGATGQVRCQRPLLAAGQSVTFTLTVRVDATAKGPFNPKAVILSGTPDSASFNDKADVITHVAGAPVGRLPFQRWLPLVAEDGP